VEYPFFVCPSTLKTADKEILKNQMTTIGGRLSREWTEQCSHLCMNSVTVTEKVNYAYHITCNLYLCFVLLHINVLSKQIINIRYNISAKLS